MGLGDPRAAQGAPHMARDVPDRRDGRRGLRRGRARAPRGRRGAQFPGRHRLPPCPGVRIPGRHTRTLSGRTAPPALPILPPPQRSTTSSSSSNSTAVAVRPPTTSQATRRWREGLAMTISWTKKPSSSCLSCCATWRLA